MIPNLFISYLSVEDIINLCHVSRIYRQLILKKFGQIYYMSTGFCSAEKWFLVARKICLNLVEEIFNQRLFDETFFNFILILMKIISSYKKIQTFIFVFYLFAFFNMFKILQKNFTSALQNLFKSL